MHPGKPLPFLRLARAVLFLDNAQQSIGPALACRLAESLPTQSLGAKMQLARNLRVESVSRLRLGPACRVQSTQTIAEVVERMRHERVGCVLVCSGDDLVGLFTERDLLRRVLAVGTPLTTPVHQCMTTNLVVVRPSESISAALRRMEEGGYRHLPVVDEDGRPLSVLSVKRIVRYLVDHFPGIVHNQPPSPDSFPPRAEGA